MLDQHGGVGAAEVILQASDAEQAVQQVGAQVLPGVCRSLQEIAVPGYACTCTPASAPSIAATTLAACLAASLPAW